MQEKQRQKLEKERSDPVIRIICAVNFELPDIEDALAQKLNTIEKLAEEKIRMIKATAARETDEAKAAAKKDTLEVEDRIEEDKSTCRAIDMAIAELDNFAE